jgi:hypothetical protein
MPRPTPTVKQLSNAIRLLEQHADNAKDTVPVVVDWMRRMYASRARKTPDDAVTLIRAYALNQLSSDPKSWDGANALVLLAEIDRLREKIRAHGPPED